MSEQKEFRFNEVTIGQKDSFEITITESLLDDFAKISGDYNPLHMDENYAKTVNFKKRICHGMLLASFFSKFVGMLLPGKNSLYFSQTLNFQNPGFIGDELTIEGEVFEKSDALQMISLNTRVINSKGQCLVDGIAKVIVRS